MGNYVEFHTAASTGFRIARSGPRLDWLTEFAARLAELLTERP